MGAKFQSASFASAVISQLLVSGFSTVLQQEMPPKQQQRKGKAPLRRTVRPFSLSLLSPLANLPPPPFNSTINYRSSFPQLCVKSYRILVTFPNPARASWEERTRGNRRGRKPSKGGATISRRERKQRRPKEERERGKPSYRRKKRRRRVPHSNISRARTSALRSIRLLPPPLRPKLPHRNLIKLPSRSSLPSRKRAPPPLPPRRRAVERNLAPNSPRIKRLLGWKPNWE